MGLGDDTPSSTRRMPTPVSNPLSRAVGHSRARFQERPTNGLSPQTAPVSVYWTARKEPLVKHGKITQPAMDNFVPICPITPMIYGKKKEPPSPFVNGEETPAVQESCLSSNHMASFPPPAGFELMITSIVLSSTSEFYHRGGKNIPVLLAFLSAKQAIKFVGTEIHATLFFTPHAIKIEFLAVESQASTPSIGSCIATLDSIDQVLVWQWRDSP